MITLGLLAIFRNEAHILKEFIEHYLQQGIDKFYLINNASTDGYLEIVEQYGNKIVLLEEPYVSSSTILTTGGRQVEAYNEALPKITTDWLYVCDLDELAYGQHRLTLKTFVEQVNTNQSITQYLVPLKTFNSSGHIKQPASVIQGFTQRRADEKYVLYKPICLTKAIKKIKVNYCHLHWGITTNTSAELTSEQFTNDVIEQTELVRMRTITTSTFNIAKVVSNHYTTQSKDWYFTVKATRGTATWHGGAKMSAQEWFTHMWNRAHSWKSIEDLTLINIYNNANNS